MFLYKRENSNHELNASLDALQKLTKSLFFSALLRKTGLLIGNLNASQSARFRSSPTLSYSMVALALDNLTLVFDRNAKMVGNLPPPYRTPSARVCDADTW